MRHPEAPCSSVTIFNRTGKPLYLTLKGPWTYSLTITEKIQNILLLPGTYKYSATACGGITKKGTIMPKNRYSYVWFFYCDDFED